MKEIPSTQNGGISADNKVITLKLHEDITWSDGTPITAQDFAFTYQMANDIQNLSILPYPYNKISQLDTPDDHTVVMTFSEPFIAWEATLWHGLLPAHILKTVYEQEQTLDAAAWNLAPTVGCGPFVFTEWVENDHVRFVRNENYWLGKPNIDEIYIRFATDDAAQTEDLLNGQGDLGTFIAFSDAPSLESAGLKIVSAFSGYNEGWIFYLNPYYGHPALLDIRVRQAIAIALDRFTLNRDLLHGLTQPAVSYWDNTPYIDPSISAWPYDPERAKQLLDEAGWVDSNGDGVRDQDGVDMLFTLGTITKAIRQSSQEFARQQLEAVGIKLELVNFDEQTFFKSFDAGGPAATGQMDIIQYSMRSEFPDPNTSDFLCSQIPYEENPSGVNWMAFCNEELDRLFQLQATQFDPAQRQQTFHQISKLIFERVYFLGLWQDSDLWAVSPRLLNVQLSGVTPFYNINEWDVTH
ncbi:MAG: peptide ABC transporter substrate-binding protein [Chloroflexota bacterium]